MAARSLSWYAAATFDTIAGLMSLVLFTGLGLAFTYWMGSMTLIHAGNGAVIRAAMGVLFTCGGVVGTVFGFVVGLEWTSESPTLLRLVNPTW